MADTVVQGVADLDITPFLTALTTLSQRVTAAVATINTEMQGLAATMAPITAALSSVSVAANRAAQAAQRQATAQLRQAQTQQVVQRTATAAAQAQAAQARASTAQAQASAASARATVAQTQAQHQGAISAAQSQLLQAQATATTTNAQANLTRATAAQTNAQTTQQRLAQATAARTSAAARRAALDAEKAAADMRIFGSQAAATAGAELKLVEDRLNSIYRAGAQIAQVSMSMMLLGGAITGVLGLSIKAAAGFDFWVRRFIAAGQAAGSFKMNVKDVATELEKVTFSTGASAEQVGEAASRFEQAMGIELRSMKDVSGVAKILETVLKATTIAKEDAGTAIIGVTQGLGAYGLVLNDAVRITMAMSNAAQIGRAQLIDYIESIKMVGSVARAMNVDIYESLAVLTRLSDVGQQGTQAGRGLQRFLAGMVDPSKEAAAAWAAVLGRSWRDLIFPGGQFVGLIDKINAAGERQIGVIGQIYLATKNLTQADREQFLAKITTENAYRVISPLIQSYGDDIKQATTEAETGIKAQTKTLVELNQELRDSTLQAKLFSDQWETVGQSIEVAWSQQWRELEAMIRDIGIAAHEALLPLVRTIAMIAAGIRQWAADNSELFRSIVMQTAIVGGLLFVIGLLGFALGQIIQFFTSLRLVQLELGKALTAITPVFASLGWSIIALIAVVIVLSNIWRNNWFGMSDTLKSVVAAIVSVLAGLINIFIDIIGFLRSAFMGDWQKAFDYMIDIAITAMAMFALTFGKAVVNLGNDMFRWGAVLMGLLALGIVFGGQTAVVAAVAAVGLMIAKMLKGFSPPKEGPLKEIQEWGENVIGAYAEGVKKGGTKKVKDAAQGVAQQMSKPLEGHSPAKEGPLKDVGEWAKGWMDEYLKGLKKADFSVLNEVADLVVGPLKDALTGKKLSPESFIGRMHEVKGVIASIMATVRQGGQVASSAFDKVRAIIGSAADDAERLVSLYSDLVQAETRIKDLKETRKGLEDLQEEQYNKPKEAIEFEIADLEITKRQWVEKKDAIDDAVEALNRQKWPLEDEKDKIDESIDGYREKIRLIDEAKHALDDQKRALEEQKYPIQEIIDGIQEEIENLRASADAIRDQRDALKDEKDTLKDTIKLVEEKYDKEREAARTIIDDLKDQLDLLRDQNDEKLKALQATKDAADAALSGKQKDDKKEEEVLERKIADYRRRGASTYYIDKLQGQLEKLKERHEDEQQILKDSKDAATAALDAKKKELDEQEESIQKQIKDKQRAEKDAEKLRIAAIEKETAAAQARIKAIDKEDLILQKKAHEIDREIAADERRIKIEQDKQKGIDKQLAAIDKQLRAKDKEADLIEHSITAEEKKERNIQKQLDILNKDIQWFERRSKAYDDELKIIDRKEAMLNFDRELLDQQNRSLEMSIKQLDLEIEAAEERERVAQEEYDTAKAIIDMYQKDRLDAKQASKEDTGWKPGEGDFDPAAIAKKLNDELEQLKEKLKGTFSGISESLEDEKKKIRDSFQKMFEGMFKIKGMPIDEFVILFFGNNLLRALIWIKEGIESELAGQGAAFGRYGETIGSLFAKLGKSIGENWDRTWNEVVPNAIAKSPVVHAIDSMRIRIQEIFNEIKLFLVGEEGETGLIGGINDAISLILGEDDETGLRGIWNAAFTGISVLLFGEDGKTGIVGGIHDFFVGEDGESGLIGAMRKAVGLILGEDDESGLRRVFKTAFDAIKTAIEIIKSPIDVVTNLLGTFIGRIGDAISKIGELLSKIPGVEGALGILGMRHSGGSIPQSGLYSLQQGEYVLSRATVANLERARGAGWQNQLTSGMASLQMGINSTLSAMKPASGGGPTIVLQVGTLIADDRGLTELERRLKKVRVLRDNRIAV